jgi:hypothetical protein
MGPKSRWLMDLLVRSAVLVVRRQDDESTVDAKRFQLDGDWLRFIDAFLLARASQPNLRKMRNAIQ